MTPPVELRAAHEVGRDWLLRYLTDVWHTKALVAHDEEMWPAEHDGFVALDDDRIVGHVSYRVQGRSCEVTAISATPARRGVGSLLMAAVVDVARTVGCSIVWVTTTNDNLDALRFYQRQGFRLRELRPGAVDRARAALKPAIPEVGTYGIPMRDEIDLELALE